jgi:hypothetical protein
VYTLREPGAHNDLWEDALDGWNAITGTDNDTNRCFATKVHLSLYERALGGIANNATDRQSIQKAGSLRELTDLLYSKRTFGTPNESPRVYEVDGWNKPFNFEKHQQGGTTTIKIFSLTPRGEYYVKVVLDDEKELTTVSCNWMIGAASNAIE